LRSGTQKFKLAAPGFQDKPGHRTPSQMPEEYPVPAGPADHCRVGCSVEGGVLNMKEASPDVGAGLLGLGEDLLEFGDAVVADELEPSKFRAELPAYEL